MTEKIEAHILLNATDFGLKHFLAMKKDAATFFVCITQDSRFLPGEVTGIKEAYKYFNKTFGKQAQPPVKIKQKWGWITLDIKQADSPDPNDPGEPCNCEVTGKQGIKEIASSCSELIVFIKSLFKTTGSRLATAAKKLSEAGVIKS